MGYVPPSAYSYVLQPHPICSADVVALVNDEALYYLVVVRGCHALKLTLYQQFAFGECGDSVPPLS